MSVLYSVVLADGTRHPAADLATLNAWAIEGRIQPDTLLTPEGSNATLAAATIPGLRFPADYPRRSQHEAGRSAEMRSAWICAGLAIFGFLLPCFGRVSGAAGLVGIFLAYGALRRREPLAGFALALNAIGLIGTVAMIVFARSFLG